MDRSKLVAVVWFTCSLLLGALGAEGCSRYRHHNLQHYITEQDHQILQQITPLVQELVRLERQRQGLKPE